MLMAVLIIVGCVIIIALMVLVCAYPQYVARFTKFLFRRVSQAAGRPVLKPEQEEAKAKAKKLTPYISFARQIDQIVPGQTLRFKIARERWGADFVNVELNPQYPQSGNKYILSTENAVQGMPGGKKTIMYDSNNPIEIAASIMDRNGELLVVAGEMPVSAKKVVVGAKKKPESTGTVGTI